MVGQNAPPVWDAGTPEGAGGGSSGEGSRALSAPEQAAPAPSPQPAASKPSVTDVGRLVGEADKLAAELKAISEVVAQQARSDVKELKTDGVAKTIATVETQVVSDGKLANPVALELEQWIVRVLGVISAALLATGVPTSSHVVQAVGIASTAVVLAFNEYKSLFK